ncbi:MAG TPA: twin-arginine translocation signal domain-containing protein, partial [Flavihumibacter sp.]|nr:twin-arginine translocation signal domain-containing protein [Flavihumibacter sp.]
MTTQDFINQRLAEEARLAQLQVQSRRHFLKESAMGLGALAM